MQKDLDRLSSEEVEALMQGEQMVHGKILVYSGKSGSGKTYQFKKLVSGQNAQYFHVDELLGMMVNCIECAYTEEFEKADLTTRLLSSGATLFAFDDIDYGFKGKIYSQMLLCETIHNLAEHGCQIAIGVIDIEDVPIIKQFLASSPIAELVEWRFLHFKAPKKVLHLQY